MRIIHTHNYKIKAERDRTAKDKIVLIKCEKASANKMCTNNYWMETECYRNILLHLFTLYIYIYINYLKYNYATK